MFSRLFSTPEIVPEVKQTPPVSNGKASLKQTNLVDVEVHHNGNGLNGNNHLLVDEDEGEGKSLEEDLLLLDKSEDHLEKSNGTPTSGIVDDEDDSFSDPTNDLNTISNEHSKQTEIKHIETVKHHHPFNEIVNTKNKKWNNLNETTEIKTPVLASNDESANDSLIDNSLNLTSDITVDSIKEHFNNLSLRNDVDLFDKDGELN